MEAEEEEKKTRIRQPVKEKYEGDYRKGIDL